MVIAPAKRYELRSTARWPATADLGADDDRCADLPRCTEALMQILHCDSRGGCADPVSAIVTNMKTISVTVLESDHESFRHAARARGSSIAQLIRDAMSQFRREHLDERGPLRDVRVLVGHRLVAPLPDRSEIYDEAFGSVFAEEES